MVAGPSARPGKSPKIVEIDGALRRYVERDNMRDNDPPTSDGQIRGVPSRKIAPDGRFEDCQPQTTNGRRLSRLGYLTGRAPRGRAVLVPGTRPISRRRQKVGGASLRGTRPEQTGRGLDNQKSYYATLDHYLKGKFRRPPVGRFAG